MQLDDYLLMGGCVLVAVGAGLIYFPAGVIAAGVEMIGIGFLVGAKKANDGIAE